MKFFKGPKYSKIIKICKNSTTFMTLVHNTRDHFYYQKEIFASFLQKPNNEKIHQTLNIFYRSLIINLII